MFCPKCGKENLNNANKYCTYCGNRFTGEFGGLPVKHPYYQSKRKIHLAILVAVGIIFAVTLIAKGGGTPRTKNGEEAPVKHTVVGTWENAYILSNYEEIAEEKAERNAAAWAAGKMVIADNGFLFCRAIRLYSDGTYEYIDFDGDDIESGVYELIHDGSTIVFDGDSLVFDGDEFDVSWSGKNMIFSSSSQSREYTPTAKSLESYR